MPTQNAVIRILETLAVPKVELAVMLGVSERAIRDWEELSDDQIRSSSSKARRAWRLLEAITHLKERHGAHSSSLKLILNNGRIPLSSDPDEDMSLISYICAHPSVAGWPANVDAAFTDYNDFVESREANRAVKFSNASRVR